MQGTSFLLLYASFRDSNNFGSFDDFMKMIGVY